MAIQKNFVIKNGVEINSNLIFGDAVTDRVGIGTTRPIDTLHVVGGIAGTSINLTGVGTIPTLRGTSLNYTTGNIVTGVITSLSGTDINYSGVSTAGSYHIGNTEVISNSRELKNIVSLDATTTATIETAIANAPNTFTDLVVTGVSTLGIVGISTLNVSGIATLGTVQISSGIVTASSGIVTYYGDGQYLQNILSGVGVATAGGTVGTGATILDFRGAGISTVTVSAGIATINIEGGGGGGSGISTYADVAGIATVSQGLTGTPSISVSSLTATNASFSGIVTASNSAVIKAGTATTALIVEGDARVTGILTVGTGSLTLDGSNNSINGVTINAGIVSAVSGIVTYYGDGSNLDLTGNTTAGVSSTSSVNTVGVVTAGIFDGFIAADQKVISADLTLDNGQENISFAEDLVIGTGVTFTVSTGSTVRMDAFNVINASVVSASVDLDIPNGTIAQRPVAPVVGSIRWNTEGNILEFYDGTIWRGIALTPMVSNPSDTGVFGGGSPSSTVDYITIATTGNATSFGNLSLARSQLAACSSSTRGVFGGGSAPTTVNTIDYITIATTGNATSFGNLSSARVSPAACSSSTRGVFGGGFATPAVTNTIDYITIASTGEATDFGDLTVARDRPSSCSSSTRGVFGGGNVSPANQNVIDYITIATTGNATDFGDLTVARQGPGACSSSTRGVFGGGYTPTASNTIDYITIASTGNAIDFGDLTVARGQLAACSSSTRGVFGGGGTGSVNNTLDYITIATTGNATDFGDLTVARQLLAACSSAHGGLS